MTGVVRLALLWLMAAFPLYGTFVVIAPRPPIPPLVPVAVAWVGIVLVVAAAIVCAAGAVRQPIAPRFRVVALAAGLATILAALAGYNPMPGIALGVLVMAFGLAFWCVLGYADALLVRDCARALVGVSLPAGLLALVMLISHRPAAIYAYDNARAVGSFINPNELACYLLLVLGVAGGLAAGRDRADRWLGLAGLAVASVTLVATWSRWGLLSAAVGLAVYAVLQRRRAVVAAAVAILVAGIAVQAVTGAQHHAPRDLDARRVAWSTGVAIFLRHPLIGVGPLAFERVYDANRPLDAPGGATPVAFDPHGIPLAFLAESGIVGFGTLLWSVAAVLAEVRRRRPTASVPARRFADATLAGFLAVQVMVVTNTISLYFALSFQGIALALVALETWGPHGPGPAQDVPRA